MKDFPPEVANELQRLHDIVQGPSAHFDRDQKEWAKKKIDTIHGVFFSIPPVIVGDFEFKTGKVFPNLGEVIRP